MKIGSYIRNDDEIYTIVAYYETENSNVAMLVKEEKSLYVTVRDLTRHSNGNYHWYFGHYTTDFEEAAKDYSERKSTLT